MTFYPNLTGMSNNNLVGNRQAQPDPSSGAAAPRSIYLVKPLKDTL